ncbi:DUF445 domain-containing protein [Glacieibacterium megasporae]|uniref:DUF445 domain-containing protein n=1 Tax=Glacieibacterium megasporae TaxID=2835787 RepID=UPI001C1E2A4D|nr:DUF445 domain-containing protein [Polymorphobacter megasporae]UAJ08768.1 DUF445 domain-containing protein [Polymorphobacter megasporae]
MAFTPFVLPSTPFHRMRLLATLLLVAMAAVFAFATWARGAYPDVAGLGYLRAFAEASLVGGLADWFAVTALFRHPLGLPIPHTAIIPTNKDRIGDSLAAFLKDNFLTPAVMARRMEGFDVAAGLARWLSTPSSGAAGGPTGRLRRALTGLVARFVGALDDEVVAQLLAVTVTDQLRTTAVAPGIGRFLGSLVADGRHEAVIERVVIAGLDLLDTHEADIHAAVAERSGKWVPAWVDEKISTGIIDAVRARLLAMSDAATVHARRDREAVMSDFRERRAAMEAPARLGAQAVALPAPPPNGGLGREHPDRIAITGWLTRLSTDLQNSGSSVAGKVEAAKLDLLDSPATAGLFASLWDTIKGFLADGARPGSEKRAETTSRFAAELGGVITANPVLADALNTLARRAVVSVVATYGASVVRLVSDTIRSWDAGTVTDKLEQAVGRDLQYIRINGTVIGGLIGLAIHAVEVLV